MTYRHTITMDQASRTAIIRMQGPLHARAILTAFNALKMAEPVSETSVLWDCRESDFAPFTLEGILKVAVERKVYT